MINCPLCGESVAVIEKHVDEVSKLIQSNLLTV